MADQSFLDQYVINPVQNAFTSLTKGSDLSGLPYSAQEAALARRQKMAELLMQQGQQQPEVLSYKGIAAQPSVAGGLGKALSQFMGAYMGGKAEEDLATAKAKETKDVGNIFAGLADRPDVKTEGYYLPAEQPSKTMPIGMPRGASSFMPEGEATNMGTYVPGTVTPGQHLSRSEKTNRIMAAMAEHPSMAALAPMYMQNMQNEATEDRLKVEDTRYATAQKRLDQQEADRVAKEAEDKRQFQLTFGLQQRTANRADAAAARAASGMEYAIPGANYNLTGDDFLKTVPMQIRRQVQGLAQGTLSMNSRMASSKEGRALINAAMAYDPTADESNIKTRFATRQAIAPGGKIATSDNSLNTVIQHAAGLAPTYLSMGNTFLPSLNVGKNFLATNVGGSGKANAFDINVHGISEEAERAYRNAGGSESSIRDWRKNFSSDASPQTIRLGLQKLTEMLGSKMNENERQVNNALGGHGAPYQGIAPETQELLNVLNDPDLSDSDALQKIAAMKTGIDVESDKRRRKAIADAAIAAAKRPTPASGVPR